MLPKKKTYYYKSNLQPNFTPNIPFSPISNFYNNYNLDSYTNHTVENIYNLLNFAESSNKIDNNNLINEAIKKEEIKSELQNTHFNGLFSDYKHNNTPIYYHYEKEKKIPLNEKIKNCIFCSTTNFSYNNNLDNFNILGNSPNCMFCNNIINSKYNNECESDIEEINEIKEIVNLKLKREYTIGDLDKIEKKLFEINELLDEIKSTNIEQNLKIKESFIKKSISINIDKINAKIKNIL